MHSIAERHNVDRRSMEFVLSHQQHRSMTTRPDNLTISICRLDAILERKFEMMVCCMVSNGIVVEREV